MLGIDKFDSFKYNKAHVSFFFFFAHPFSSHTLLTDLVCFAFIAVARLYENRKQNWKHIPAQ